MPETPYHPMPATPGRPRERRPAGTDPRTTGRRTAGRRTTVELVDDLLELIPRLIREELALAAAEMREKGRRAGAGAGLLSGGGVLALFGGAALVAAAVLGLARVIPDWLAALVVGVVLLTVAGVLALVARQQVTQAVPPAPQRAIDSVREDIATVKERATP